MKTKSENRLRKEIYLKYRYILRKSTGQNLNIYDQGGFKILDSKTNVVIAGSRYELTLEDVQAFLEE